MSAATAAPPAEEVKHYALHYSYVPDAFEKRVPFRPAHLALTAKYKSTGKMLQGGAYTEPPMGALLTFHTTRSEVESFVKNDPYVSGGVVTEYKIREWTVVVGSASNPNYAGVEPVKAGTPFPKGLTLTEKTDAGIETIQLDDFLKGKKVIIFGVPGAFTPGCSKTHLPGYVADADKFKSKGVNEILCLATNDAFVMAAWGESAGAKGKVRMVSDVNAEVIKNLGLAIDLTSKLGSVRSKRWSLLVEDGVITQANIEPPEAPTGMTCSLSSAIKL